MEVESVTLSEENNQDSNQQKEIEKISEKIIETDFKIVESLEEIKKDSLQNEDEINNNQTKQEDTKISNNIELSYRDKITKEIIETEKSYVKSLEIFIEDFLKPLRNNPRTTKNVEDIFGNVDEVLYVNQVLKKNLEEIVKNQEVKIGQVFNEVGPYLKPYYISYTKNFAHATQVLKECEKGSEFSEWLEQCILFGDPPTEISRKSLIKDLMIMPVQRIPRYTLLLSNLLEYTPPTHPDYENLGIAVERTQKIAADINKAIEQGTNKQKILNIQNNFLVQIPV